MIEARVAGQMEPRFRRQERRERFCEDLGGARRGPRTLDAEPPRRRPVRPEAKPVELPKDRIPRPDVDDLPNESFRVLARDGQRFRILARHEQRAAGLVGTRQVEVVTLLAGLENVREGLAKDERVVALQELGQARPTRPARLLDGTHRRPGQRGEGQER